MPQCDAGCTKKKGQHCDRHFNIGRKIPVTITQYWHRDCLGLPGGAVWEGAIAMAEYIVAKYSNQIKNATVLELGCGPGLIGVLCGLMGASQVVITDHDEQVLDLAKKNIENNSLTNAVCEKLPWGEIYPQKFDFIFGSEVTYSDGDWGALATTILGCAKSSTKVIISEAPRYLDEDVKEPGAEQFYEFLSSKSKEYPFKLVKPEGPEPAPPDVDPEVMSRCAGYGIFIWEMNRKSSTLGNSLSSIFKRNKK